jgi:hypothetical protein
MTVAQLHREIKAQPSKAVLLYPDISERVLHFLSLSILVITAAKAATWE